MNIIDIAWAAGLFEGEGSIGFNNNTQLQIQIAMTDEEPIQKFREILGFGIVSGPYYQVRNGKMGKPIWHYSTSGYEKIQVIMAMFWIWLSPRRKEQFIKSINAWRIKVKNPMYLKKPNSKSYKLFGKPMSKMNADELKEYRHIMRIEYKNKNQRTLRD